MARRTSKKKTTTRRKRRVSGVGKLNTGNMIMSVAGIALGTVAASILVKKALASQSEMIQGGAAIAAGIAIPMFVKNPMAQNAGYGMIALGVTKLLTKFNIAGVGDVDEYAVAVSGDELSVLAGDDDFAMAGDDEFAMAGDELSVLAGIDEED